MNSPSDQVKGLINLLPDKVWKENIQNFKTVQNPNTYKTIYKKTFANQVFLDLL